MALKRMTTAEMVQISTAWTTNGSPARKILQSTHELAGLLPKIEAAHKQLHAARPSEDDPRGAEIAVEAAEVDARHDAVVRGVDLVLEGASLLAGEGARRRAVEAARAVLTPDGLKVISSSYRNEAGAGALLKSRLGHEQDVKTLLASITVDKKKVLASFVNERIVLADRLGVLEDERAKLAVKDGSGSANSNARNAWIRVVNALVANADLAELTAEQTTELFGALRQTEAKADRRGKTAPAEPTPGPADPGTSGDAPAAPGGSASTSTVS